ncbi:MAG: MBL fold metallo-hydrolase [Anaerolineales bacterium]|nr:MBL fold metallo-hydrolase [Anaerolineales bacterium]
MADFQSISANISRLQVHWGWGPVKVPVAVWMVREGDAIVLIDSGPPGAADEVVAAVARATEGRGPQQILLTHAHPDHAGGLEALRAAWNPAILCHREEVPFVTGERKYRELPARSAAFWLGRYFLGAADLELPVARDLERGESVVGMVVIHLPGHSPGQVGFLHPHDGTMICGDAVRSIGGQLRPPSAWTSSDPAAAQASMERLAELDYDHLLPSHGPPLLYDGRAALRELVQKADDGGTALI